MRLPACTPPRSLEEMAVAVTYSFQSLSDVYETATPAAGTSCRLSTRTTRHAASSFTDSTVSCGIVSLPPPLVRALPVPRKAADGGFSVQLLLWPTKYHGHVTNPLYYWKKPFVCVCDATTEEMDLVLKAQTVASVARATVHDAHWDKFRKDSKRARKAAATRRRRKKPKKPKAFQSHEFYPGEKLWESSTTQSEYVTESESEMREG